MVALLLPCQRGPRRRIDDVFAAAERDAGRATFRCAASTVAIAELVATYGVLGRETANPSSVGERDLPVWAAGRVSEGGKWCDLNLKVPYDDVVLSAREEGVVFWAFPSSSSSRPFRRSSGFR